MKWTQLGAEKAHGAPITTQIIQSRSPPQSSLKEPETQGGRHGERRGGGADVNQKQEGRSPQMTGGDAGPTRQRIGRPPPSLISSQLNARHDHRQSST